MYRYSTSFILFLSILILALAGVSQAPPKQVVLRHDRFFGGPYSVAGQPFLIRGDVTSIGNETFESVYLNYQVDENEVQTTFFDQIGINPYFPFHYQAGNQWVPEETGEYLLKIWFTGLNGAPSTEGFSDTLIKTVAIYSDLPLRQLSLLESFSSINCGSCAIVAPVLRQMVDKDLDKYAMIYYHPLHYEGSPLFQFNPKDQTTRKELYDITYTPVSAIGATYLGGSSDVTPAMLDLDRERYAGFDLSGTYAIENDMLYASVDLAYFAAFAESEQITLLVAVTEREVHFDTAPGSNGEKDFYHVMRSFLPDANGTQLLPETPGTTRQFTFQYDMSGLSLNQELLSVLAFVQDTEALEIHQAVRLTLQPFDPTNTFNIIEGSIRVYPN
ncbi:MAG: hypothetical protein K0B09_13635, partial [Bacteroidales bacterium]|nr:hypothetical protein [Bacteroidales bacterium]